MVPDIIALSGMDATLASQVIRDYGSLERHGLLVRSALGAKPARALGE
jgi:hypothetical protein